MKNNERNLNHRSTLLDNLAFHIGENFGIDPDKVYEKIMEFCNKKPRNIKDAYVPKFKKNFPDLKAPTVGTNICKYPLSKGKKKVCGTTIRGEGEFCSKHRNKKLPE